MHQPHWPVYEPCTGGGGLAILAALALIYSMHQVFVVWIIYY